ncbi:MAG TPA: ABC transporter permease [Pseudogracilibacillus sp.]|nr:ABC transporter permease [Pseudogracilibacillus sp.]
MIGNILFKQAKIFIRNRQQLFLLLLLPIILIVILSTSLGALFSNDGGSDFQAKMAIIEHETEAVQIERVLDELETSTMTDAEKEQMKALLEEAHIIKQLKHFLNDFGDDILLVELTPEDKRIAMEEKEVSAVIEIPAGFTYNFSQALLQQDYELPSIRFYEEEGEEIAMSYVKEIIKAFQEETNIVRYAMTHQLPLEPMKEETYGEVIHLAQNEPITSKQYYSIGMAVMNVLYVASAIGSFAFLEKKLQVFNRIILSNVSSFTYFTGIFLSGALFSFIQLLLLFTFSYFVYDVEWPDLVGFFVVTAALSLTVGSIGVLLSVGNYRLHSETLVNFFGIIVIGILALLGGSFFPIGDMSYVMQKLGEFTPNGAGMTAYLSLLRGDGLIDVWRHIVFLVVLSICLLAVSMLIFPKRGDVR